MTELPVLYYASPWGEMPIYSGLKSAQVLLWVPGERRWIRAGNPRRGKWNAVFRTVLSKPSAVRRRVQEAVRFLPPGLRGRLLVWVSYSSHEDCVHWGLALDQRVPRRTGFAEMFGEAPRRVGPKEQPWDIPEGIFPAAVRCRGSSTKAVVS